MLDIPVIDIKESGTYLTDKTNYKNELSCAKRHIIHK